MSTVLGEYWVTFEVLETEAGALEGATAAADDRVGGVVWQEPSDGTAMVVFNVVADDPDSAWHEAELIYEQLRELAGLANAPSLGGSVTRLQDAPPDAIQKPYASHAPPQASTPQPHERVITRAVALLDQGEYEHATIAAQTACEVAIGDAMRRLIARDLPALQKALEGFIHRQCSLSQPRMADLWQALTGEDMRQAPGNLWNRFDTHRKRRNAIVHEGRAAAREEAEHDVQAAREVCDYVTRLSQWR
jgi:hypothetical protein